MDEGFDSAILDQKSNDKTFLFSYLSNVRKYTKDLQVAIVGKIYPRDQFIDLPTRTSLEAWVDISFVYSNEKATLFPRILRFSRGSVDAPSVIDSFVEPTVNIIVLYSIPDAICHEFLSSSPIDVIPELNSFGTVDLSTGMRKRTRRASIVGISSPFSVPASHHFRLILRLLNSAGFMYSAVLQNSLQPFISPSRPSLFRQGFIRKALLLIIRLVVFPILIIMGCVRVLSGAILYVIEALNINKSANSPSETSTQSNISPQPSIISSTASERAGSSTHYPSLLSISYFARQLRFKIREFSRWPFYLQKVQQTRDGIRKLTSWPISDSIVDSSGDTSMMFGGQEMLFLEASSLSDSTWRFVFDLAVGVFIFSLFHSNGAIMARNFTSVLFRLFHLLDNDVLRSWVKWLLEFPAGLKLNLFLGRRLGGVILIIIDAWKGGVERLATSLVSDKSNNAIFDVSVRMVLVLSCLGLGGVSLLIAAALDILSLLTLHIELLRKVFAFVHRQFLSLLGTLFLLMRGKKRNVLRNRIDSVGFGDSPPEALAHLLLGVILFAITFFLFPTAAVYYSFLTSICLCLAVARSFLLALLTFLNNVPLYAPLCALFFRKRVPAEIEVQLIKQEGTVFERRTVSTLDVLSRYVPGTPLSDYLDQVETEETQSDNFKKMPKPSSRVDLWFNLENKAASPVSLFVAPFVSAMKRLFKYHLQPAHLFNAIVLGHSFPLGKLTTTAQEPPLSTIADYWKTLLGSIDFALQHV